MEIRTPDPLIANEVLYQLSYGPLFLQLSASAVHMELLPAVVALVLSYGPLSETITHVSDLC